MAQPNFSKEEIEFANKVSAYTGIDPRVLLTQYTREGAPGNYPGYFNYGNMPDSTAATLGVPYKPGAYGFADYGSLSPGAKATAREYANLGLGHEGGKTIYQQLQDIQNSPWASSHYGGTLPATFVQLYGEHLLNTKTNASGSTINPGTGGGGATPGSGSGVGGVINDLNPANWWSGITGGIEGLAEQAVFMIIGLGLIVVGLALIAWTVMGRVGAPGIIGMAQSQMRIQQSGRRIQESTRASTARESLRGQSLAESGRASRVREEQAAARLEERQRARELSERRLEVHERGVERREPRSRKFSDVKRDDRTVAKKKPGRKVSGAPKRK